MIRPAQAARIMAASFLAQGEQAGEAGDDAIDRMLTNIGHALDKGAVEIERLGLAEAKAMAAGHRCSIDHRTITATKCPACGAAKGGA